MKLEIAQGIVWKIKAEEQNVKLAWKKIKKEAKNGKKKIKKI